MSKFKEFIGTYYSDCYLIEKSNRTKVWRPRDNRLWTPESISAHYTSVTGKIILSAKLELPKHIKYVQGTIFDPSMPFGKVDDLYNVYQTYEPVNSASQDLSLWHEYLERLFPDTGDRHIVVSYLAHVLQKPWERPVWHLIITGDFGCGKSSLFDEVLKPLTAQQAVSHNSYSAITKDHSLDFGNRLAIAIDDPIEVGRYDLNKLRRIANAPEVTLNPKGEAHIEVKTYVRFFIFSNDPFPVKIAKSERRWWAPAFVNHRISQAETIAWLGSEWSEWLCSGGLETIYDYLMDYDISEFNVQKPPYSALVEQWKLSSVNVEDEILEDFIKTYPVFTMDEYKRVSLLESSREIKAFLKDKGFMETRVFQHVDGYKHLGNIFVWRPSSMKSAKECRSAYLENTKRFSAITGINNAIPSRAVPAFTSNPSVGIKH